MCIMYHLWYCVLSRVIVTYAIPTHFQVYSLPKNSKLESVSALNSGVDVQQLQNVMAKSIASIMGVPFEIIGGMTVVVSFDASQYGLL